MYTCIFFYVCIYRARDRDTHTHNAHIPFEYVRLVHTHTLYLSNIDCFNVCTYLLVRPVYIPRCIHTGVCIDVCASICMYTYMCMLKHRIHAQVHRHFWCFDMYAFYAVVCYAMSCFVFRTMSYETFITRLL